MGALRVMPLGRRRHERAAEARALAAARSAVANVVACFCSDPDVYEVRASIAVDDGACGINVFQLQWDDGNIREAYFLEGDTSAVIARVDGADDIAGVEANAQDWIGRTCSQVRFIGLPGLFQHVYVKACVQRTLSPGADLSLPLDPLTNLWVCSVGDDTVVARLFPSGLGENAPPIGKVGFVHVLSGAVGEMYRHRGW